MVYFNECTEMVKAHLAKKARREKFVYCLKYTAAVVAGTAFMYGMLWLGAFLDYVYGV